MPDLPNPAILPDDGLYEIPTIPGRTYLLVLGGSFDGATVTLRYLNPATAGWASATDGVFNEPSEVRITAPSNRVALLAEAFTPPDSLISVIFQLLPA